MLNDNYTQRHILLFANYITLIVSVICAMFNHTTAEYVLAEVIDKVDVGSSGGVT